MISYTLTGLIFGTLGMLFGAGLDTSLSVLAQAALKVVAGLLMLAMGLSPPCAGCGCACPACQSGCARAAR